MARQRPYLAPWVDSGTRASHLRSTTAVLRFVLSNDDVVPEQQRRIVKDCLWFITEADGKYTTRFRSRGVLDLEANGPLPNWRSHLRHEHVVTRKALARRLFEGEDPEQVLKDAVACVVTVEEHDRLSHYDATHEGWARYEAAGIEVVDMLMAPSVAPQ